MGLAAWAIRCPHVLIVPVPGYTATRLAVEAAVDGIGGVFAASTADADVLVVAGRPGAELAAAVETAWAQLPGPRARASVDDPAGADAALRAAVTELATDRGDAGDWPGELMMADRADDRGGRPLDALHVPLGPVLADWPAGLVVDVVVQGDVVQQARPRVLPPQAPVGAPLWREHPMAGRLDSLGRLLGVLGASAYQRRARALRDALLRGEDAPVAAFERRMRRSWSVRWAGGADLHGQLPSADRLRRAGELMVGRDLAAARIVMARYDPDPDELVEVAA